MPEGRVRNTGSSLKAEYIITDHQGNARVSFEDNAGAAKVVQENSYYAFGLNMASTMAVPTTPNKNLYNGGSEWQNDYDNLPDWQQTFYRNYDQTTGRFLAVDPMAEASEGMTPYQYAGNNPVMMNDPMGDLASWKEFQDVINRLSSSSYGGEWHKNNPDDVMIYSDNLTGFYMGAAAMGANGSYGANPGWAQNYNIAAANYNETTTGPKAAYSNGNSIVIGRYYHDANGNPMVINGVSGEFESIPTQNLVTGKSNESNNSNFGSPSAIIGYEGIVITKSEILLRYTAKNASKFSDAKFALRAANGFKAVGRYAGVAGALSTGVEDIVAGKLSWGTAAKVGIGVITTFTPYGWVYGVVDLGVGILTGETLTDRIGDEVNSITK